MTERHGVAAPALILLIAACTVALLWPTFESLERQWSDTETRTYSHGYLIVALSLWLLLRTARARDDVPAPDWRPAVLLAMFSFAWLIMFRAGIEIAHQLLMPMILFLALCTVLGWRAGRRYGFACGFLYFATSIWAVGNGVLQWLSVRAVKLLLRLTAVPAFVDGNVVAVPEGSFEVQGGCSGLSFFIVALALSLLFGELSQDSWKRRVWQALLAVAIAMVANWIRIYVIIVVGHATDMQHYLVRVDHYYFGWIVFAVGMAVYFWLVSRVSVGAHAAANMRSSLPTWTGKQFASASCMAIVALGLGPMVGLAAPLRAAEPGATLLPAVAGWTGPGSTNVLWQPQFPHADRHALGGYVEGETTVVAFVAEYDVQHQDKELVGYGNSLREGLDSPIEDSRDMKTPLGRLRVLRLGGSATAVLAFHYQVGSVRETRGIVAQLRYAFDSLRGPVVSRIVAAYAPCGADCDAAEHRVLRLLDAIGQAREEHR